MTIWGPRASVVLAVAFLASRSEATEPCRSKAALEIQRTLTVSKGTATADSPWISINQSTVSFALNFDVEMATPTPIFDFVAGLAQYRYRPLCGEWISSRSWEGAVYLQGYTNGEARACVSAIKETGEPVQDCSTRVDLRRIGYRRRGGHLHHEIWSAASSRNKGGGVPEMAVAARFFWSGEDGNLGVEIVGKFRSEVALQDTLRLDREVGPYASRHEQAEERQWLLRDVLVAVDLNAGGSVATWQVSGPAPLISSYVDSLQRQYEDKTLFYDFGTRLIRFKPPSD